MPFYRDTDTVAQTALELLSDDKKRDDTRASLKELMGPLIKPGAAKAVVEIIRSQLAIS